MKQCHNCNSTAGFNRYVLDTVAPGQIAVETPGVLLVCVNEDCRLPFTQDEHDALEDA